MNIEGVNVPVCIFFSFFLLSLGALSALSLDDAVDDEAKARVARQVAKENVEDEKFVPRRFHRLFGILRVADQGERFAAVIDAGTNPKLSKKDVTFPERCLLAIIYSIYLAGIDVASGDDFHFEFLVFRYVPEGFSARRKRRRAYLSARRRFSRTEERVVAQGVEQLAIQLQ